MPQTPPDASALLAQAEAECKRLDSLEWSLSLTLNIRTTLALASTLALAIRSPELNHGPSAQIDRAMLDFIIAHLGESPLLQSFVRERAAQSQPARRSYVPN